MNGVLAYTQRIESVAVDTNLADSKAVPYADFQNGTIYVPSGSSLTTLTFHVYYAETGTFIALYNSSNAAVTRTVAAGRAYAIPDECRGAPFFKITGNADGTVAISLKS